MRFQIRQWVSISIVTSLLLTVPSPSLAQSEDPGVLYTVSVDATCHGGRVEIVDLKTSALVDSHYRVGLCPAFGVSPDGRSLYLGEYSIDGELQVTVLDAETSTEMDSIPVPGYHISDFAFSDDGLRLYVASSSEIIQIDASTNTVLDSYSTPNLVPEIRVSPDGELLLALDAGNRITFVETASMTRVERFRIDGSCSYSLAQIEFIGGGRALVRDMACNTLFQIDLESRSLLLGETIDLSGAGSQWVDQFVYSPLVHCAYVVNGGKVDVIDLGSGESRTLEGPDQVLSLAISRDHSEIYITNQPLSGSPSMYRADVSGLVAEEVLTYSTGFAPNKMQIVGDFRRGTVNLGAGAITEVLSVNGKTGRVVVGSGDPVDLALDTAPQGPAEEAGYVLWFWPGESENPQTLAIAGETIGRFVNPTPIHFFLSPQPAQCLDGGLPGLFCSGLPLLRRAPASAPWSASKPGGFGSPIALTFQGVIEDDGAGNAINLSSTNAVTLVVE